MCVPVSFDRAHVDIITPSIIFNTDEHRTTARHREIEIEMGVNENEIAYK